MTDPLFHDLGQAERLAGLSSIVFYRAVTWREELTLPVTLHQVLVARAVGRYLETFIPCPVKDLPLGVIDGVAERVSGLSRVQLTGLASIHFKGSIASLDLTVQQGEPLFAVLNPGAVAA